jgi:ABC-type transport system substrate-binding protein
VARGPGQVQKAIAGPRVDLGPSARGRPPYLEYLKSTWAKEGIDVTLEPVPFAQLITLVTTPSDRGK